MDADVGGGIAVEGGELLRDSDVEAVQNGKRRRSWAGVVPGDRGDSGGDEQLLDGDP
jgi:hypothetical protein